MWIVKKFKSQEKMNAWIVKNEHKVQYTILYVNNGYALEYKPLRIIL
jgi:CHASE1-domain containing sensor protein